MKNRLPLLAPISALLPALLLSACTTTAPPLPTVVMAPPVTVPVMPPLTQLAPLDETSPLLAYHQSLRRKSPGELLKELSGLNLQQPTPRVTIQMGMILMLTRGPGDLARAQALFDSVATSSEPAAQGLAPLAALLSSHSAESRRLSEQADRLAGQLKENQRKTEQLNEMLEGLKAIERNLPVRPTVQSQSQSYSQGVK